MAYDSLQAYPLPPADHLKSLYLGKSLRDLPTPAAIIDRAKAEQNCRLMLSAVESLKVSFRAHVKTHKCSELTRMQVGQDCKDVRLIVSSIIEAEHLTPSLLDFQSHGARTNVLYGVPVGPDQIARLAALAQQLGPGSITVMIDHPAQLRALKDFKATANAPISIYIKADSGSHRAGIDPAVKAMSQLVQEIIALEDSGDVILTGFYSHAGHSYGGSSPSDAMEMLQLEIGACQSAAQHIDFTARSNTGKPPLTLSVGASPTVLSIQNLDSSSSSSTATSLRNLLSTISSAPEAFTLELHAGVYPLLDMQQLSTQARPIPSPLTSNLADTPFALTILTTVHSLYPSHTRANQSSPEALIAAGCLALGREPCKSYAGWGVVTDWNLSLPPDQSGRIIVKSISQEHGILAFEETAPDDGSRGGRDGAPKTKSDSHLPLSYGQKLRIIPNHACIACSMYAFYVVVDSSASTQEERDKVVDVWVRWRGW